MGRGLGGAEQEEMDGEEGDEEQRTIRGGVAIDRELGAE